MSTLRYQRVLLKLSGEAFGSTGQGVNPRRLDIIVRELKQLRKLGVAVAVVVGAGNIWRKRTHGQGLEPAVADYIGLLATVMNGLALRQALIKARLPVRLQSAVVFDLPGIGAIDAVAARGSLRRGEIVIFAGGTGKPFFTTDTAAAQRAVQVGAEIIIKTSQVSGVYEADPRQHQTARKFDNITLSQAIRKNLKVMDKEAFKICLKNKIPILVCQWQKGVVVRAVLGKKVGTLVKP